MRRLIWRAGTTALFGLAVSCGSDSGSTMDSRGRGSGGAGGAFGAGGVAGSGGAFGAGGSAASGTATGGAGGAIGAGGVPSAAGGAGGLGGSSSGGAGGAGASSSAGGTAGVGGSVVDAGGLDAGGDGMAAGDAGATGGSGGMEAGAGTGGADAGSTGGTGGMDSGSGGTGGMDSGSGGTGGMDSGSGGTGSGSLDAGTGTDATGGAPGTDAGTDPGSGGSGGTMGDAGEACLGVTGPSAFPDISDFAAAGPFDTTSSTITSPACTVFRPATLGEDGRDHPIIVWGNGTFTNPSVYQAALDHWASHGFIVIAANTSNAGSGTEMLACLDYLEAENVRSGSVYEGHVDTDHVGTSGHSQGGGGAIMAGTDPRVTTTAPLQPYTQQGFGGFDQDSIDEQQGPMFLMSGSADMIASPDPNQQRVYDGSNVATFWGTLAGADHVNSATGDISGYRGPATAWFRWHLMHDTSAAPLFCGQSCALCADQDWNVQRKGF